MNAERFAAFSEAYRAGLLKAVQAKPEDYLLDGRTPEQFAETVSARMLVCIKGTSIRNVNLTGAGMRYTCKTLGIKHTYKAIDAYLRGES